MALKPLAPPSTVSRSQHCFALPLFWMGFWHIRFMALHTLHSESRLPLAFAAPQRRVRCRSTLNYHPLPSPLVQATQDLLSETVHTLA